MNLGFVFPIFFVMTLMRWDETSMFIVIEKNSSKGYTKLYPSMLPAVPSKKCGQHPPITKKFISKIHNLYSRNKWYASPF
jgi:hypothetical protein